MGKGSIGSTTIRLGKRFTIAAVSLPDRQVEPEVGDGWVRFTQTAGGRTGLPAPRPVRRAPFVKFQAPIAWSTLELTLYADGRAEGRLVGASPFPRHWIYDADGRLSAKTGMTDFKDWAGTAFGAHTPWGDEDSPALVTAVETALERELSNVIMRGGEKPTIRAAEGGIGAHRARATRATRSSSCSTACWPSTWTTPCGPRSARAPYWANERRWNPASAPLPCAP